jgi:hypothetical protein
VFIDSNGRLDAMVSSGRFKEITDMGDSSSKLLQLRPVNFFYKPECAGYLEVHHHALRGCCRVPP